jgi:flavin-dependent dehydrogenase
MASDTDTFDVAIMGGGLAGLSLALQLMQRRPETRLVVMEKRSEGAPEAAFKVGESLSGVAGVYFRRVLGLTDHLEDVHISKNGVRFFFSAGDNSDITRRVEFANVGLPSVPLHHIDRGVFEDELWARAVKAGAEVRGNARVQAVELDPNGHTVTYTEGKEGPEHAVRARWVVDAAGRSHLLKNKLGLHKDVPHRVSAAWMRVAGGLDFEQWGKGNQGWLDRMPEYGYRTHFTNHLMGEGYWAWLIQLGTGPISIGLCADMRFHDFQEFNTREKFFSWLHAHEPQLAASLEERREDILDFLTVGDYSYSSTRAFSPDRWATTGDAGTFADPFLSPGSDYIAYANNYSTDLIVRDLAGDDIEQRCEQYNFLYFRSFEGFLAAIANQYGVFGNPEVMIPKLAINQMANFALLGPMFAHGKMTDLEFLGSVLPQFPRVGAVATRLAALFSEWGALGSREWADTHVLLKDFPAPAMLENLAGDYDDDTLRQKIDEGLRLYEACAILVFHRLADRLPDVNVDEHARINPRAVSVHPAQWESDGMFSDDGISLVEARELIPGHDEIWIETWA